MRRFIALALLLSSGPVTAQAPGFFDPARTLVRLADANGDGAVEGPEWETWVAGLGANEQGELDRYALKLRLLQLDSDGDGAVTAADVELALAEGASPPPGDFLGNVLRILADVNQDQGVSPQERAAFLTEVRTLPEGPLDDGVVIGWLQRAEAVPPPDDPNAWVPGVILLSIDAALDVDSSGVLTLWDLQRLREGLDRNGDGTVSAEELRPPSGGGAGWATRQEVSSKDREREPLMPWQRTLDDALALVQSTGKPLLICVNMDGENASESLAWGRYRDPDFAALADGFIPVLASPDRRESRERDDRGRRLADRRFGRLVNSEHIDIEPELYERYFQGNRVAPRHVGVSPEGDILFDVFLIQDLSIIDDKLREFGRPGPPRPNPARLGVEALLRSPDAADRSELERRFVAAAPAERERMARLALDRERPTQHPELLHLGLRDPEPRVRNAALTALAQRPEGLERSLLARAMAELPLDPDLAKPLILGLERDLASADGTRRAEIDPLHRRLLAGAGTLELFDAERWKLWLRASRRAPERDLGPEDMESTIDLLEEVESRLDEAPEDPELIALAAELHLRLARIQLATGGNPMFSFQDAQAFAEDALRRDPEHARALGYRAWASYMLSDFELAAQSAALALPGLGMEASGSLVGQLLGILAADRTRQIYAAMGEGRSWEPRLLTEAMALYDVLLVHPDLTEAQVQGYLQLLETVSDHRRQGEVVLLGLERFPTSPNLHGSLRSQRLRDGGSRALEAAYFEEVLQAAREEAEAELDWFQGLGSFVAAEQDVQNRQPQEAIRAYARSFELFQRSLEANESFGPSARHYQALGLVGRARILAEEGKLAPAVALLTRGLELAPDSGESADGLGKTPLESGRELRRQLEGLGEAKLLEQLETCLTQLRSSGAGA